MQTVSTQRRDKSSAGVELGSREMDMCAQVSSHPASIIHVNVAATYIWRDVSIKSQIIN